MNSAVIMSCYLLLTMGVGIYLSRSNKSTETFFVAKKGLGVGLIVPLLFAELIAGAGTIGNAEMAFRTGLSSVWAQWGMAAGCILFVIFVSRFYWIMGDKQGVMSVPEAFGKRFDERTRLAIMMIISLAYSLIYSTQPVSAAAILAPMFNISVNTTAWVVAVVIIIITITGGLKGAAYLSIIHSFVMYFGMFLTAAIVLRHVGGYQVIRQELPNEMFHLLEPGIFTVIAWILGTAFSFFTASTVVAVTFGAKSLKSANRGIVLGAFLIIPFALSPALIGLAARAQMPHILAKNALFEIASSVSNEVAGMASMGVIAAILSTAPVMLLITVTTLTRDLYKGIIKPQATDQEQMRFSQVAIIGIGLAGTYFGLQSTSILGQLLGALQIRSIAGVVLVISLLWPRVSNTAVFYSIITGGVLAAGWHFAGSPFGIEPLWPSLIVGIPLLVVLSLCSSEKVSAEYKNYHALSVKAVEDENQTMINQSI
ncbi:sodium:solute symporter family protein [Anoxynatronum buryatiense]|uniref:Solute:Na+ symporter, SSS family n=1 Tax=Anoxynatronum buryatiense TaxID=489973 RepID=A0AA46AI14_9CLOT|nr:sodium:solute symporter family protein [Anoxynatronum buryatiense]SMP45653.1 solute:Na+ symporter, SSS family [Anoxynatronum buryatiense]